jgi:antitoxin component YwqK of YwqJK toxin-antitoxin module
MKKIFSHLNLEDRLNIIRFNKTLQKKINISIEDYKMKANGRYRVKRHKGVVKIFSENGNVLLFKGKYLHEKKNGKGKEYNEYGELIYEGEYKNGKRNGKGKEYDGENHLIFEGEYLNGKKWNGRGYKKYGEFIIKNYLINKSLKDFNNIKCNFEIKDGKGTILIYGYTAIPRIKKIIFEGNFINGDINGIGKEYTSYGQVLFEGEFINGIKWNGKGEDNNSNKLELKNGYGKIYNRNNQLIYEGDYLNCIQNGKGKEYRLNKLIFEGEYKNGKREGKGKEYKYFNNEKKIIFEGEYLNGNRWKGKEYDYNSYGNIVHEREYQNIGNYETGKYIRRRKIGRIREIRWRGWRGESLFYTCQRRRRKYIDLSYNVESEIISGLRNVENYVKEFDEHGKLIYWGEHKNGKRNGEGIEYTYINKKYKIIFDGEFLNGIKWNGKIKEYDKYGYTIFEGKYLSGKKNGIGKEYNQNGLIFEGEYKDGKRNGKGKEYNYFGDVIYEGEYKNGKRNGKGKEYDKNGNIIFEGKFKNGIKYNKIKKNIICDIKDGKGSIKEYNDNNKLIFEGEYLKGKKWKGKEYDYNGILIFEGEYFKGKRNGKGKEYYYGGKVIFEGEYLKGKRNGKGKEYDDEGKFIVEGEYRNGRMIKGKEYNYSDGKLIFEGEYFNGGKHGKAIDYDDEGNIIFKKEY